MIVKPERGQATLIWERKSLEISDQQQANAHFHSLLPSLKNFFLFFFFFSLTSRNYQNLLPDWSNHCNPEQIPCDILLRDVKLVSECSHPCFISIWSAVQQLMTVTSSETDTHYNITPLCLIQLFFKRKVSPSCGKQPYLVKWRANPATSFRAACVTHEQFSATR